MNPISEQRERIDNLQEEIYDAVEELFEMQFSEIEKIEAAWQPGENDAATLQAIEEIAKHSQGLRYRLSFAPQAEQRLLHTKCFVEQLRCNFVDEGADGEVNK